MSEAEKPADPLTELDQSFGVNPVGIHEAEQRKQLGDRRYEKVIDLNDRATEVNIAWVASRSRLRDNLAVAIGWLTFAAVVLAIGWSVWAWVR